MYDMEYVVCIYTQQTPPKPLFRLKSINPQVGFPPSISEAGEWKLKKEKVRVHEQNGEQLPLGCLDLGREWQLLSPVLCWEPWETAAES